MDRRSFLVGAGAGALAGLAPPAAAAPAGSIAAGEDDDRALRARVDGLRRHWDAVERRTLRRQKLESPDEIQATWARSTAAMATIDRVAHVPVRDQVHPAVQALISDLFVAVGRGVHATKTLLDAALEGSTSSADVDRALARTEAGVDEESELSEASRTLNRNTNRELRARIAEEGFAALGQHEARRLRRLIDLSERIASVEGQTGVLAPTSPQTLIDVDLGVARWARVVSMEPSSVAALKTLGLIACGLGVVAGGFVLVYAIACAVACEAPGLLLIALLGAALIVLCVWGIVRLLRRNRPESRERLTSDAGDSEEGAPSAQPDRAPAPTADPAPLNVFVGTGMLSDADLLIAEAKDASSPFGYGRSVFFITVSSVSVNPSDIILSAQGFNGEVWAAIPGTTTSSAVKPGDVLLLTLPYGLRALRVYARMATPGSTGNVTAVGLNRLP